MWRCDDCLLGYNFTNNVVLNYQSVDNCGYVNYNDFLLTNPYASTLPCYTRNAILPHITQYSNSEYRFFYTDIGHEKYDISNKINTLDYQ